MVGNMGEVVRIGTLFYFLAFSRYMSHFPIFSWGLLILEQLFALVLYFRYPRVYQGYLNTLEFVITWSIPQ